MTTCPHCVLGFLGNSYTSEWQQTHSLMSVQFWKKEKKKKLRILWQYQKSLEAQVTSLQSYALSVLVQCTLEHITLLITYRNEMDAKDHNPSDEECRSLAKVSGAVLEWQQGNEISRDFRQRRQEAVQIRVAMQVWGVEEQSVVANGDDDPAHIQNNKLNTWAHTGSLTWAFCPTFVKAHLKKVLNLPQKGAE